MMLSTARVLSLRIRSWAKLLSHAQSGAAPLQPANPGSAELSSSGMATRSDHLVEGFSLAVWDSGEVDNPAALLLHGFPSDHTLFDAQVPALQAAGFRTIAPDLLGFGDSDKPGEVEHYTLAALSRQVVALLDAVKVDKVVVVGHDWGSALSWYLASHFPERVDKLVALCVGNLGSYFVGGGLDQRQKSWYMLWFLSPGAEELMRRDDWAMLSLAFGLPEEVKAPMVGTLSKPGLLTAGLNWYRANITHAMFADAAPAELPQVQCPVLGVWPSGEEFCNEAQMTASEHYVAPGKWHYKRMEGAGHFVTMEAPDELNKLLVEFLAGAQ